ncbi:hypothetical protein GPECTOR_11g187 [Gonium pectorale]|uniref:Uncharacterized protein n=1 Tax=Gonium pectorale TaxID=33097 RepID=A0A150GQW6_GONPE|nr:hypothetical protein GPECTOR_11g187 [Gonium pectorale]|eukprot:KXZ51740.1 hypothetical protein GPECTOR_11g187 [Gonium pectorale]
MGAAPGERKRACRCAIVTDDVAWVAAADGGAMERTLGREGVSSAATLAAIAAAARSAASGVGKAADSGSSPSPAAAAAPSFGALPWGGGDGGGGLYGEYDSYNAWLDGLDAGLLELLPRGDGDGGGVQQAAATTPGATSASTSAGAAAEAAGDAWDVLALPSACAGWSITTTAADAATTAATAGAADGGSSARAAPPPVPSGAPSGGASGRRIAGCVLAFTGRAAATIGSLAAAGGAANATATGNASATVMLPMVNNPLYGKLMLLSRQGVLTMRVAVPPAPPSLPAGAVRAAGSSLSGPAAPLAGVAVAAAEKSTRLGAPEPPPPRPQPVPPRRRFLLFTNAGDQVLNPPPEAKPGGREILRLASQEARQAQWASYSVRYGISVEPEVAYECVPAVPGLPAWQYPSYCPEYREAPSTSTPATAAAEAAARVRERMAAKRP